MKLSKLEEKFIAPAIEKKVSLVQNPEFLHAMELSEKEDFPSALQLLEKVVRQEPNHVDAYMEMRRIAEIQKDSRLFTRCSAAIFDIVLRNHDYELLADLHSQFLTSRMRATLPAKTLFGIGNYLEESQDYGTAAIEFGELAATYPDDPLALKALTKLYRLYFDRLSNREQGIEFYWKCRNHPLATDQWRAALDADLKRYKIPQPQPAAPSSPRLMQPDARAFVVPDGHMDAEGDKEPPVEHHSYDEPVRRVPASEGCMILPDSAFSAGLIAHSLPLIGCKFEKIDFKGIILRNSGGNRGLLPWKKVQTISVGKIRKLDPSDPRKNQEYLVIDLIAFDFSGPVVYRISGDTLLFERIFPGVEQSTAEAFQNFIGIILNNSGARCIPSRDSCTGPSFAVFPDEDRYNSRLKEKLPSA